MAVNDINDFEKWNSFCEQLLELTKTGKIEWEPWDDRISRPSLRSRLFVAIYKQWRILVYRYAYKEFVDSEEYEWTDDVSVELIDDNGKTTWHLPKVPARYALLDWLQYDDASVQGLYDEVMKEK